MNKNISFYKGKKVFITGHTGFKGAWMSAVLHRLEADAMGYSLMPEQDGLFRKIKGDTLIKCRIADVCNFDRLKKELCLFNPEIVIHFAAKGFVKECFDYPITTFDTNVLGTVNLFEAVRSCESVKCILIITTDKVYKNNGKVTLFTETDSLGGLDPYSSSKTCMELISETYKKSYLQAGKKNIGVSTARASNVIGGGDHVKSRLIPSVLDSLVKGKDIEIRNPDQKRSWQSVLDALDGYLTIARLMYDEPAKYSSQWNIGPGKDGICSVMEIVNKLKSNFKSSACIAVAKQANIPESQALGLKISKAAKLLDWRPRQSLDEALFDLVDFVKRQQAKEPVQNICFDQINKYLGGY